MMRVGYEPHGGVEYPLGVEDPSVRAVSLYEPTSSVSDDRRKWNGHPFRTFPLRPVIWCLRMQSLVQDGREVMLRCRNTRE
jgi:hypothetical protein